MTRYLYKFWLPFFAALVCPALASYSAADPIVRLVHIAGKNLSSWRGNTGDWVTAKAVTLHTENEKQLQWKKGHGIVVNGPTGRTKHLVSQQTFGDVHAHIEFCVPKGSNSGVYFMGRYEIQVLDSWGQGDTYSGNQCGGIYERWDKNRSPKGFEGHAPLVNASFPPGQWQSFDVVFRAPRFNKQGEKIRNAAFMKVKHNGALVQTYTELTGPTRASLYNDEKAEGPFMLQGDHGPVAYRNIWIRPIDLDQSAPPHPFFVFENGYRQAGDGSPQAQVQLLKKLGFQGCEKNGLAGIDPLLQQLNQQDLRLLTIYTPIQLHPDKAPFDPKLTDTLPRLKRHRTILWMHIPRPKQIDLSKEQADQRAIEILKELSDIVRPYDVRIAIYPHVWFHVETTEHALRLIQQVRRDNVGVVFNLCHRLKVDGDQNIEDTLRRALPHLFAVSINGADRGDTRAMNWDRLIQPLGQGSYDTYALMRMLADLGYEGPVGLQCYNIKEKPEIHLAQSIRAWQVLGQRLVADRLLGDY